MHEVKLRALFLLVEGDDDEMFFGRVVKPCFEHKYCSVQIWKYACEPYKKIAALIKNLRAMKMDYLFIGDINSVPCVSLKKDKIQEKVHGVDRCKLFVVRREIESWYLAGIDNARCRQFRIRVPANTENIDKEQFERLIPRKFTSRIDFMLEILKTFSFGTAQEKNKSFDYFVKKNGIRA